MNNKDAIYEKVVVINVDEKNYDTFFFTDTNLYRSFSKC